VNSSHATVGLGATTATVYLTTLLTGWHGHDASWAGAAAGMLVMAAGAVYAGAAWYIALKYPQAPALPGELVEIPPNAPAVKVAEVPVQPQPSPQPPVPLPQEQGQHQ
jgi:hypothetical protein